MTVEIGQPFDRWTVIGLDANRNFVMCRCVCGDERRVNKKNLKSGMSRSCGCLGHERRVTHGMCGTPTYMAWGCMKQRVMHDKRYIDKGIKICDRWLESFENFLEDMGVCPDDKYSVDRIENDKGYYKENCRWASRSEQQRNKTDTRMITFNGKTQAAADWADELGMRVNTIKNRLDRGWSVERTLTEPEGEKRGRGIPQTKYKLISYNGKIQTVEQWAKELNLNLSTMIQRVWDKWSMDRIVATPQGIRGGHKKYEAGNKKLIEPTESSDA